MRILLDESLGGSHLPARVLRRVDETANRLHESRSGFLARAALEAIRRGELTR